MPRSRKNASTRLKEIRPFVNFNYDLRKPLTKSAKAKIKKYHDLISEFKSHTVTVKRFKRKDRLKAAQAYSQTPKGYPALKVAFIPGEDVPELKWTGKNKLKIKVKKKGGGEILVDFIEFDEDAILDDPGEHVRELLKEHPDAKWFTIAAGIHEMRHAHKRNFIAREVERLAMRYSGDAPFSNPDQNHYYGNWMRGLRVYDFKNQESAASYMQHKQEIAAALAKKRKNARRRKK